jgi:catechol 2,3-dioxygenase-like lactoylglutathione lyase family enzyme
MTQLTHVGRIMVPVADQDAAIAFYVETLGFTTIADVPFGDGERWVEVAPPGGGAALALVPASDRYPAGRMTGIALGSSDPRSDHAELRGRGVDADAELMGGGGGVPLLFFFRDIDGNQLMVVGDQAAVRDATDEASFPASDPAEEGAPGL